MFNSLRGLTGNRGTTGDKNQLANVDLTFDDGDAMVNFENQLQPPPAAQTITHQQEEEALAVPPQGAIPPAALQGGMGQNQMPNLPPANQATTEPKPYLGLETALKNLGHMLYSEKTIDAELAVQSAVSPGDPASKAAFREFVVNVQQLRVYLAMLGGQPYVTMIHTPGVYYSVAQSTTAYQGKVLAFIGNRRATKEPTPVCLPASKTWDWHTGQAVGDFEKLGEFYAVEANKGKLWTPGAGDGMTEETKVPHLLAIPNVLIDLLQNQGPAITPYDVLATIDDFITANGHPGGPQWDCVKKWCIVASQTGANGRSKVFLDTSLETINNEEFHRWVGNRLDVAMGPRPTTGTTRDAMGRNAAGGGEVGGQQALDYLTLSKLLTTTIGANMMQFSQAIGPQVGGIGAAGADTALATGKGFDQDQIAKLKDTCGVPNAQQIPTIWLVIQATKGKSIDTYCAHIATSINSWCQAHHIDRDKSIFLEAKFFEDLVALCFNPGGPVAQYHSASRGISILACRSLTAVEAKQCRKYQEAAESTKHTRSINDLLKRNRSKPVAPATKYMDLKLNIGTYCGLLWALFGDHCDYYK
jgi:hypothetical protein